LEHLAEIRAKASTKRHVRVSGRFSTSRNRRRRSRHM
jgi:hypothetical protein